MHPPVPSAHADYRIVAGSVMTYDITSVLSVTKSHDSPLEDWILAAFSLSLITNLISVGLILFKTAKVHWDLRYWGGSRTLLVSRLDS